MRAKSLLTHTLAIMLGASLTGTVAVAATNYVQAVKQSASVYINGSKAIDTLGLRYDNKAYVQVGAIQQSLAKVGVATQWDGSNLKMTIPFQPPIPGPNVVKVQDMPTFTDSSTKYWGVWVGYDTFTDNLGNKYTNGGMVVSSKSTIDKFYLLKGQYKKLIGTLAPASQWNSQPATADIGYMQVFADGNKVYDSGPVASDILNPIPVNVNLTGAQKVEIVIKSDSNGGGIGFVNASFIR